MRTHSTSAHALTLFLGVALFAAACGDSGTPSDDGSGAGGATVTSTGGGGTGGGPGSGGAGGGPGTGGGGGLPDTWVAPTCDTIQGTDAVTFTMDEGDTLTPTGGVLHGIGYTGLAALDTPNTLLAEHKGDLLRSTDAGCTWTKIGALSGGLFRLTAAPGGRAYAWVDNGNPLYRIDDGVPTALTNPAVNVVGIGVDPADGLHLRTGDASGAQRDSIDGGVTWSKQGVPAPMVELAVGYRMAYDPADLDHAVFGQSGSDAQVTFDGGATWTPSFGLGKSGANIFSIAISPVDGDIVWVEALEVGPNLRHIYRSSDGGLNFDPVVDESATVDLINGTLIEPHPTNADAVYFVFGQAYADYGTDIFEYDHGTATLTQTHNANDNVSAIVANPADPSVLYFGLVVEEGG